MIKSERFAIDYFLEDYPKDASYKTILEIVRGQRMGWIEVWTPFQEIDSNILVGLIVTLKNSIDEKYKD